MKRYFRTLRCVTVVFVLFISVVGCTEYENPTAPETPYQLANVSAVAGATEQIGAYVGKGFFKANVPAGDYLLSYKTEKFGVARLVFRADETALVSVNLIPEDQVLAASLEGGNITESDINQSTGPVTLYAWPGSFNGMTSTTWNAIFHSSSSIAQMIIDDGEVDTGAGTIDLAISSDDSSSSEPEPEPELDENVLIYDTLKDGQTDGTLSDGSLTNEGAQLYGLNGYVGYSIPTTPNGYIEFNARGFQQDELHGGSEYKSVLLTMWSGNDGYSYEHVPFIFELRKYGYIEGRPDASNAFFFKIKSNGVWEEGHFHVLGWDPNKTYRIRVEWGGGSTRAFRDGELVATGSYYGGFSPSNHKIQIGANPLRGRQSPEGLLISDVVIGTL